MDTLRSCYTTTMRFPGVGLVPVRWYWTDALPLDKTHVYGSHNHSRADGWEDGDTGEPGEVWGAERVYNKGESPGAIPPGEPRGSDSAWLGESDESYPLFHVPDGVCFTGSGGIEWAGRGVTAVLGLSGVLLGGQGVSAVLGQGGEEWGGDGTLIHAGHGGTEWGGLGRLSYAGSGGTEWAGAGRLSLEGTGGYEWAGNGRLSGTGRGGYEAGGTGHLVSLGSGGYEWAGTGRQILRATGGLECAGNGRLLQRGSGGTEWAGSGRQAQRGFGGVEWGGSGRLSEMGSGGIEWAGTGTEVASVTTFTCGTLTAAGTTQGTATPIVTDSVLVSSSAGQTGVILVAGCFRVLVGCNTGGANVNINVYPPTGAKINGLATNAPLVVAIGTRVMFCELTATQWYTQAVS